MHKKQLPRSPMSRKLYTVKVQTELELLVLGEDEQHAAQTATSFAQDVWRDCEFPVHFSSEPQPMRHLPVGFELHDFPYEIPSTSRSSWRSRSTRFKNGLPWALRHDAPAAAPKATGRPPERVGKDDPPRLGGASSPPPFNALVLLSRNPQRPPKKALRAGNKSRRQADNSPAQKRPVRGLTERPQAESRLPPGSLPMHDDELDCFKRDIDLVEFALDRFGYSRLRRETAAPATSSTMPRRTTRSSSRATRTATGSTAACATKATTAPSSTSSSAATRSISGALAKSFARGCTPRVLTLDRAEAGLLPRHARSQGRRTCLRRRNRPAQ